MKCRPNHLPQVFRFPAPWKVVPASREPIPLPKTLIPMETSGDHETRFQESTPGVSSKDCPLSHPPTSRFCLGRILVFLPSRIRLTTTTRHLRHHQYGSPHAKLAMLMTYCPPFLAHAVTRAPWEPRSFSFQQGMRLAAANRSLGRAVVAWARR